MPSMITVSCGPCDSPAVSHLSIEAMIGAAPKALDVALIDVGGTLWPNSWPFRETDGLGRHQRVASAMPMLEALAVDALVADLIASSRIGDEARAISTETPTTIAAAEVLIAASLERQGLPTDLQTVARIRRAMALPVADRMKPLPGAQELLAEIHALGLRTVIASNTYWRDAGVPAERCVVIGNREENDIEPALALGMKTILVHPDDPKPASSRAHAVATDLWECASVLKAMLGA